MLELERRFLVDKNNIPFDNVVDSFSIEQSYYQKGKVSVRIRHIWNNMSNKYIHCVKYMISKYIKEEIESEISKETYNVIMEFNDKIPIQKIRYNIPLQNGSMVEVDEFSDKKFIAEVEFDSVQKMNEFVPPEWFGKEITENGTYSERLFAKLNNEPVSDFEELNEI